MAKRIVKGNDFYIHIPMRKFVDGTREPFSLSSCRGVTVSLVSAYRCYVLDRTISKTDDSVIIARVEGDKIPCGVYAVEVRGKLNGDDWRSFEYDKIEIVHNNEKACMDLGELYCDAPCIEMDTIGVQFAGQVLNPRGDWDSGTQYHRGDVVSHDGSAWVANGGCTDSEPSKDNNDWTILVDLSDVYKNAEKLGEFNISYEDGYLTLDFPNIEEKGGDDEENG